MYIKNALVILFLTLTTSIFSQITIDDVGDGWKNQVDSALSLIKLTSPEHWNEVNKYCKHITFWIGDFSTTVDSNTVMISRKAIYLNSINNLACTIIHESHHLMLLQSDFYMKPSEEELSCYLWEWEFLKTIENPEPWLQKHIIKCISAYSNQK